MEVKVGQIYLDGTTDMTVRFVSEAYAIVEYYGGEVEKRPLVDFVDFELMSDVEPVLSDLEIVQKALIKSNRADHREASLEISSDGSWIVWNYIGSEAHQIALGDCIENLLIWAKQTIGQES